MKFSFVLATHVTLLTLFVAVMMCLIRNTRTFARLVTFRFLPLYSPPAEGKEVVRYCEYVIARLPRRLKRRRCLIRSGVLFLCLRKMDPTLRLVVGMQSRGQQHTSMRGHCWVVQGEGVAVYEAPHHLGRFTPILSFP